MLVSNDSPLIAVPKTRDGGIQRHAASVDDRVCSSRVTAAIAPLCETGRKSRQQQTIAPKRGSLSRQASSIALYTTQGAGWTFPHSATRDGQMRDRLPRRVQARGKPCRDSRLRKCRISKVKRAVPVRIYHWTFPLCHRGYAPLLPAPQENQESAGGGQYGQRAGFRNGRGPSFGRPERLTPAATNPPNAERSLPTKRPVVPRLLPSIDAGFVTINVPLPST